MLHSSQTIQPQSTHLLLVLDVASGFNIWTSHVTKSSLQSELQLVSDLNLKSTTAELDIRPDQFMQLLRPINDLCESRDIWYHTLARHHADELPMKHLNSDPALHYLMKHDSLCRLSGTYVDVLLRDGNDEFMNIGKIANVMFETAPDQQLPAGFSSFRSEIFQKILQQTIRP